MIAESVDPTALQLSPDAVPLLVFWAMYPPSLPLVEEMRMQAQKLLLRHSHAVGLYTQLWSHAILLNASIDSLHVTKSTVLFENASAVDRMRIVFRLLLDVSGSHPSAGADDLDVLSVRMLFEQVREVLPVVFLSSTTHNFRAFLRVLLKSALCIDHLLVLLRAIPGCEDMVVGEIIACDMLPSSDPAPNLRNYWILSRLAEHSVGLSLAVRAGLTQAKHLPSLCSQLTLRIGDISAYLSSLVYDLTSLSTHWFFNHSRPRQGELLQQMARMIMDDFANALDPNSTSTVPPSAQDMRNLALLAHWTNAMDVQHFVTRFLESFAQLGLRFSHSPVELRQLYRVFVCLLLVLLPNAEPTLSSTLSATLSQALLMNDTHNEGASFDPTFQYVVIVCSVHGNVSCLDEVFCAVTSMPASAYTRGVVSRSTQLVRELFLNINMQKCIRKFIELEQPTETSAATETPADWLRCLEVLLAAVHSKQQHAIESVPGLHDLMLRTLKSSGFPPHSRLVPAVALWRDCFLVTSMSVIGMPLLPNEVMETLRMLLDKHASTINNNDIPYVPSRDTFLHLSSIDEIIKLILNDESEVEPMVGTSDDLMVLSLFTWYALLWTHGGGNKTSPVFSIPLESLPIKTALKFLYSTKAHPVAMGLLRQCLDMLKDLSPYLLLPECAWWIRGGSGLGQLDDEVFALVLGHIVADCGHSRLLFLSLLSKCSITQLNRVAELLVLGSRKSSIDHQRALWATWTDVYGLHDHPADLLLRAVKLLVGMDSPVSSYLTSFEFFVDEPILVFRFPKEMFAHLFSLNSLLLLLKTASVNSKSKIQCTLNYKSKARVVMGPESRSKLDAIQGIDTALYFSIQDSMIVRLLLELVAELNSDSLDIIHFFEWLTLQHEDLVKLLLQQGISRRSFKFLSSSSAIMNQIGAALVHSLSLSLELPPLVEEMVQLIQSTSYFLILWKQKPLSIAVISLIPAYICRTYSLFSIYHDLASVTPPVIDLLIIIADQSPTALSRFVLLASKASENSMLNEVLTGASAMYGEGKSSCVEAVMESLRVKMLPPAIASISVANGRANTIIAPL